MYMNLLLILESLVFSQHHFRWFEGPVVISVEVPEDAVIAVLPGPEVSPVEVCEAAAVVPPAAPAPRLTAVPLPLVLVAVPGGEGHTGVDPKRVPRVPRVTGHVKPEVRALLHLKVWVLGDNLLTLECLQLYVELGASTCQTD